MTLYPIKQTIEENQTFSSHADLSMIVEMSVEYYNRIGYIFPWVGYVAGKNGQFVGSAGYKGIRENKTVEISYYVVESFQNQGFGSEICKALVDLALKTDPSIKITARTLPEENFSTRILRKNNFELLGTVQDDEDGDVWEWEYRNQNSI